jgi:flagellar biosynthetic protein FliP
MNDVINQNNPVVAVFFLVGFLSLLPAILIMFTSFTRIVVVLSFLRQALGGQQIPPNPVIIGLSLFITLFIMYPTIDTISKNSIDPYLEKKITIKEALSRAEDPVKAFMVRNTREKDLELFLGLAKEPVPTEPMMIPLKVVAPAFAISELKTAFEIGFLIYLPFIIIDMVVASIMLSMGMMMVPPVMISMPFKLLLFVLVDGWNIIIGSLVRSFH